MSDKFREYRPIIIFCQIALQHSHNLIPHSHGILMAHLHGMNAKCQVCKALSDRLQSLYDLKLLLTADFIFFKVMQKFLRVAGH